MRTSRELRFLAAAAVVLIVACHEHPAPRWLSDVAPGATGTSAGDLLAWEQVEPQIAVLLVNDLGISPRVWDLPGTAGLAGALWSAGAAVYAVDPFAAPRDLAHAPPGVADAPLAAPAAHIAAALERIAALQPGVPVVGVGHGLGGTALYDLAVRADAPPLAGIVILGAPLVEGGRSRALQALFEAPRTLGVERLDWAELGQRALVPSASLHGTMTDMLLTTTLPEDLRRRFFAHATAAMPASLLDALAANDGGPVPEPGPRIAALAARPDLPVLVLMGLSDGFAPPWQCDPATLGLRRANIERVYLGRPNGDGIDYNHLDLILHPDAESDVYPRIIDWLAGLVGSSSSL